jgi:hypothetical protein
MGSLLLVGLREITSANYCSVTTGLPVRNYTGAWSMFYLVRVHPHRATTEMVSPRRHEKDDTCVVESGGMYLDTSPTMTKPVNTKEPSDSASTRRMCHEINRMSRICLVKRQRRGATPCRYDLIHGGTAHPPQRTADVQLPLVIGELIHHAPPVAAVDTTGGTHSCPGR